MRSTALISALSLLAFACNGEGPGNGDDTDTDTGPEPEPGCILVDGDGGYRYLNDAIELASDGSTITLCDIVEEEVVVNKAVTIEGDGMTLKPPVNTPAVRVIDGGDLTISDVTVETTRSAFVVEDGGTLDLAGANLSIVPNYGVDVQAGGTATVDATTFTLPVWGAARVSGGDLTISNSTMELRGLDAAASANYGIIVENEGTARLENNTFGGAWRKDTNPETDLWNLDGVAVSVKTQGSAELVGNEISASDTAAILVDGGSVTLTDDTMNGNLGGIIARNASVTATNIDITNYFIWGVVCLNCSTLDLDSVTVTTEKETSSQNTPPSQEQPQGARGSQGILGIEVEANITGTPEDPSVISGNNGAGIVVTNNTAGGLSALNMSDTIVEDNTAFGVSVYNGELTMTDATVRRTANDESYCLTETGYQCDMGVGLWSSNGTFENAVVEDSDRWGVAVVGGVAEMTGGSISRNETYGVFAQAGSLVVDGTAFTEGKQYAVGLQQGSSGVIQNASFADGAYTSEFEYMSGEDTIRNVSFFRAQDLYVGDSTLVLTDTTFTNGERGLTLVGADTTVTAENLTFNDYNQWPVYLSSDADFELVDSSFDGVGRQAIYCFSSDVTLENVTVQNTTAGKSRTEVYRNDELENTFDSEFADEAMYFSTCDLSAENLRISDTSGQAIWSSNTSFDLDGVAMDRIFNNPDSGSGTAVIDARWTRRETDGAVDPRSVPSAIFNDVEITGVGSWSGIQTDAIRLTGWVERDGTMPDSLVQFRRLVVGSQEAGEGISADGIEASNLSDVTIDGLEMAGIGGQAIAATRVGLTIDGDEAGLTGTIDSPVGNGISFNDTTPDGVDPLSLSVADLTITTPGGNGLTLTNGVEHSLTNVTVQDAAEWGATCENVTFATCDATLSGTLGAHQGCDACDM